MRRTVHKIEPHRTASFDQQFWPVLVALIVLCSLAIGAILTLFKGTLMWFSLLMLPALAAFAFYALYRLDNNKLRRSLQLAIILSLAAHLGILLFASIVSIFSNPYQQQRPQSAAQPSRTMIVTDRSNKFVWQEPNAREVPETKVETERAESQTDLKPQPIPVEQTQPKPNPQITERKQTERTVPRLDESLSQLRRQTRDLKPQSSVQSTVQPAPKSEPTKPTETASASNPELNAASQAAKVERQSAKSKPAESITKANASERPLPKTNKVAKQAARANRKPSTENPKTPKLARSRLRRSSPKIPLQQKKAPVENRVAAKKQPKPDAQPKQSASEITRRPVESRITKANPVNQPQTQLSPRSQIAKSSQRRSTEMKSPSISQPDSVSKTVRRASRSQQVAVAPTPVEQPNPSPKSSSSSRELNPRTLSVSRSTAGVAGIGKSRNLDRSTGGAEASPAQTASDSSSRRRSESRTSDSSALSSLQRSTARRSIAQARTPKSAFKSESTSVAKISGSQSPSDESVESSAANIDSSSAAHRSEIAADKGEAMVDVGATKIVMDQTATRRSGGGQPELGEFNPQTTQRSRTESTNMPSLAAESDSVVAAPRASSSAPTSTSELAPSQEAAEFARSGGRSSETKQDWAATESGQAVDAGETDLTQQLADARSRASGKSESDSAMDDEDEDEDELQPGTERTRLAQTPQLSRTTDMGIAAGKPTGESSTANDETPGESLAARIVERGAKATSGLTGSTLSSATQVLMGVAASMPLTESGGLPRGARADKGNVVEGKLELVEAPNKTGRRSTSTAPKMTESGSTIAKSAANNRAASANVASATGTESVEPTKVTVERSTAGTTDGAALDIVAIEGPAGLADRPSIALGTRARPASKESNQIQPDVDNRYRSTKFGGTPALNPEAVLAKEAFSKRSPASRASQAPSTEASIQLGLEFLARHQLADGSWALTIFDKDHPMHRNQLDSDAAGTGLALLAFQGAGYNHREFKYASQMSHAIRWMVEHQRKDGCLFVESDERTNSSSRMYTHGIAALALTEAYGMTQDPTLKEPAQKALDYIKKTQHRRGGWRYYDTPNLRSTDTSVSGWMMMALKSGQLAGLETDADTYIQFNSWMRNAADVDNESLFRYNPNAIDSEGVSRVQGRRPTPSMTAVGLLMKMYTDWERDDERLRRGADWLLETQMPSDATSAARDTYYWYYATQVMKHMGGDYWKKWNAKLHPLLIESQQKSGELAGSWDPYGPVPDRWGSFGGRLYVTTMNLLSLEVRYRLLPLYDKTVSDDE